MITFTIYVCLVTQITSDIPTSYNILWFGRPVFWFGQCPPRSLDRITPKTPTHLASATPAPTSSSSCHSRAPPPSPPSSSSRSRVPAPSSCSSSMYVALSAVLVLNTVAAPPRPSPSSTELLNTGGGYDVLVPLTGAGVGP
jgi:hypothetical protein